MKKVLILCVFVILLGCDSRIQRCNCYHHSRCNNYSKFHNVETCPITLQENKKNALPITIMKDE